jgi:hypothetical protein
VNANSGDLVVDMLAADNTGVGTWSAGTGQNQRWLVQVSIDLVGAGSDKPASSPVTMTWSGTNIYGWTLIAVQLEPTTSTAPVGGVVMPANMFAIAAPWLAFIGLVGCVGTVVVVSNRCKKPAN